MMQISGQSKERAEPPNRSPTSPIWFVFAALFCSWPGFTVGALAIVLAFSSAPVFETLAEKGNPQSFFMKLIASLIHFILAQVLALVAAIIGRITESPSIDVLALFLLFYAVMVTFAAGLQLFLTAVIYNTKASIPKKSTDES